MDSKLGVQHHHNGIISKPPVHHHNNHGRKRGGGRHHAGGSGKQGIKVVYISSPMMLTASAEEFRAVVQELTGRDSNVADHDLAAAAAYYTAGAPSSSSSYSSFGRVSPTGAAGGVAGGARSMSPTAMSTGANVGGMGGAAAAAGGYGAAMAAPPPFQSMYDQTAGSLLYGQDYW
ncbi:unnamed protein product [Urochloa humidicola]